MSESTKFLISLLIQLGFWVKGETIEGPQLRIKFLKEDNSDRSHQCVLTIYELCHTSEGHPFFRALEKFNSMLQENDVS